MLNIYLVWNGLRRALPAWGRFVLMMGLGLSLTLLVFWSPAIAQDDGSQDPLPVDVESADVSDEVGWEFLGNRELNEVAITTIEYEGECEGAEESFIEGRFTSTATPPARRRRVTIRNVTRGVASDPYPYTDREYEEGRSSEPTRMEFGATHSSRRFRVLEGENEFEYEIRERNQVIDSGTFTAFIERLVDVRRRDATAQTETICMNTAVPLNVCADVRQRTTYTCPGGGAPNPPRPTVMQPNNPDISTLISNRASYAVEYWFNGNFQRLSPGQERLFTTPTRQTLSLEFSPGCDFNGFCSPAQTLNLQPGKRYQFRPSQYSQGLIELVDFPR